MIPISRYCRVSMSGHRLVDGDPMVNVYVDEAGTSPSDHEVVAVVASVIVPHDRWREMDDFRRGLIAEYIEPKFRDGFVFHAKDITAGKKAPFVDWPPERRWRFVKDMIAAHSKVEICVSIGIKYAENDPTVPRKERAAQRHLAAYRNSLVGADIFIENYYQSREVATVIAEDTNTMRQRIKEAHQALQGNTGFAKHPAIKRIVGSVHFAEKKTEPLLQYADAFAFSFRRILEGRPFADELFNAMYFHGVSPGLEAVQNRKHVCLLLGSMNGQNASHFVPNIQRATR